MAGPGDLADPAEPLWLPLARELQAMAQTGLTYARDPYDLERYGRLGIIAAELLGAGFALDPVELAAALPSQTGYATPQIDVRGAIFEAGRVLLVREKTDGRWALPGGWADVNLSAAQNVVKEIAEEAGIEARVLRLAGCYDRRRHPYHPPEPRHCYKLYFLCERLTGEPRAGDETSEAAFFPLDALPDLSETRVIAAHIHSAHGHLLDPGRAVEFD